jgi:hypothetical protein
VVYHDTHKTFVLGTFETAALYSLPSPLSNWQHSSEFVLRMELDRAMILSLAYVAIYRVDVFYLYDRKFTWLAHEGKMTGALFLVSGTLGLW